MRATRNRVYRKLYRGFESPYLRQNKNKKIRLGRIFFILQCFVFNRQNFDSQYLVSDTYATNFISFILRDFVARNRCGALQGLDFIGNGTENARPEVGENANVVTLVASKFR